MAKRKRRPDVSTVVGGRPHPLEINLPLPVLVAGEACPLCGEVHFPAWWDHMPMVVVSRPDATAFGWWELLATSEHPPGEATGGPSSPDPKKGKTGVFSAGPASPKAARGGPGK